MGRVKRIWYLSPMRAAKVQASLRIRAVSPEPPLLAHTSSESRGTFRQKARSLAPLNGWACAIKICHDGMLEDPNSLDAAHLRSRMQAVQSKSSTYYHDDWWMIWLFYILSKSIFVISGWWKDDLWRACWNEALLWYRKNLVSSRSRINDPLIPSRSTTWMLLLPWIKV